MKNIKSVYLYSVLFLACIAVYYPILSHRLLDFWDDQWVVRNIYTEGGFTLRNFWNILTSYYHGQYAPFNEYLYLSLYTLFGYNPFTFHLASMVLHITNVLLAYTVFSLILKSSNRVNVPEAKIIAFFTALLFAVHPFNVESVAWMSASKVLVYTFFYLAATLMYIQYIQKERFYYYVFALLLFVCSFLGKEQAVTFPVWILLLYWIMGKDLKNKKMWLKLTPFFVLSIFFGVVTMLSQSAVGQGALAAQPTYPLWQRLVYACYTFAEYLFKCFFPYKLSYLYPFPSVIGQPLPSWLLIYPLLIVVAISSLWNYLARWYMAFCLLFFGIHIGVALHIIPLSRFAVVADRYVYLSSIGITFIIAYFIVWSCLHYTKWRKFIIGGFICYILALGVYANLRSRVWYDTDTLKKELRHLLKQRNDYHSNTLHF